MQKPMPTTQGSSVTLYVSDQNSNVIALFSLPLMLWALCCVMGSTKSGSYTIIATSMD
jgi:hypothetical protein